MALLFFFILIIGFLVIVIRRQRHYSIKFLIGLMFGSALSFVAFILYLTKFNLYYNHINAFLKLTPGTLSYVIIQFLNADILIRMMNVGIALFYYSYLSFIISLVQIPKQELKNKIIYILLLFPLGLQVIVFDPQLNMYFQNILFKYSLLQHFDTISKYMSFAFGTINVIYIIIGPLILFLTLVRYIKVFQLKNYIIFSMINLTVLGIAFTVLFYWAPTSLVRVTFSKYQNYIQPDLRLYFDNVYLLPVVILLTLVLMMINLFKYRSFLDFDKAQNLLTQKKIDTASIGMKVFTHSVKNHLLAIRSETEYLQSFLIENEEAMYSLKLIKESAEQSFLQIDRTTDRLNNIILQFELCDIHKPIENTMTKMNRQLKEIELHYSPLNSKLNCMIDEIYIEEVLHNIILNAIEAKKEKDEKGRIKIIVNEVNDWAILSVIDNGIGVDSSLRERVFDPFFTTKSPNSNWGIGLPYCYKIIEGHQGRIELNSKKNEETQFSIMIPTTNQLK